MDKSFNKLKKITGLNWNSFSHYYGHTSSGEESNNDEECKSDTHSLRLHGDDKTMFGCYPISEVFELALCNYCNQKFKTSAIAEHIRLRHEDGKATEKKEVEDKKSVCYKTFNKMKKITGLNWNSFSHYYGHTNSGEESNNDEECKSDTHSLRLHGDDKTMFGCYPISEVFELALCNYCNQKFKTSAFAEHIRLRHEDGKATEKKEVEDKKSVSSQSKNRGRHKKGATKQESKKVSAVASSAKELTPKLVLSINEKLVLRECPVPSLSLGPSVNSSNLTQSSPLSSTPSTPPVGTPTLTPAATPNVTPTGTPIGTPSITPNSTPVKSYSDLSKHSSSTLHENKVKPSKQKIKNNKAQEKSSSKNGKNVPPSSKVKEKSKKRGSKKNSNKDTPSNNQDSTSTKVESCDKPKSNKGASVQDYPKLSLLVSIKNPDLLKQMQKNRDVSDSKTERNEVKVEKNQQKSQSSSAVPNIGSQTLKDEQTPAKASSPQLQEVIRATLKQSQSQATTLILQQAQPQVCVNRNSLNLQQKQLLQQEALKALHRQQMLKRQQSSQQQNQSTPQPAQQQTAGQKNSPRQTQQSAVVGQNRHKQFVFIKDSGQKQQNQILKPVVVQGASRSLVVNNSNVNNSDSKRQVRNVIMSKTAKENGRDVSSKSQFSNLSLKSSVEPSASSPPSDSQENDVQWWQPGFKRFGGLLVSRLSIPYKKMKISQNEFPTKPRTSHFYLKLNRKGEKPNEETPKPAVHLPLKEDGGRPMMHFVKFNNNQGLRKNDIPTIIKL